MIRAARAEEAPVLAAVHLESAIAGYGHIFPPDAPPPPLDEVTAQWQAWLADDGVRAFVADAEGHVLATGIAMRDHDEPHRGHLARLYVRPDRWGQGIGRAVYDACVADLAARAFADATLWVLEANTRARTWYERLGWELGSKRKVTYAPAGIDDVQYVLRLR